MHLLAKKTEPGRSYARLDVAKLASGADLQLALHVVTGKMPGPTLGILTTIHGDETMPLIVVRELLNSLDVASLSGRVAAIPVANPLAVSVFNRQTPEQHGRTDLHEVFPGNPQGNLTQRIASVTTSHLLDHVDALVDIHCGGSGGRLQSRADLDASASPEVYEGSLTLCRAFAATFVHANNLAGTAARYCNSRGVPTVNPEIGGVYLGPQADAVYLEQARHGLRNIIGSLGMSPAPPRRPRSSCCLVSKAVSRSIHQLAGSCARISPHRRISASVSRKAGRSVTSSISTAWKWSRSCAHPSRVICSSRGIPASSTREPRPLLWLKKQARNGYERSAGRPSASGRRCCGRAG